MGTFLGVVGAGTVVYFGIRIVATVVEVIDDWRNGWTRWKSGHPEA